MCTWIIFLWMPKAGAFAFKQLCFLFHRESGACCMRRAVPIEKTIFSAVLCGERDALSHLQLFPYFAIAYERRCPSFEKGEGRAWSRFN